MHSGFVNSSKKKCISDPPIHRCHGTQFLETPQPHNNAFSNKNGKACFGIFENVGVQEETPQPVLIWSALFVNLTDHNRAGPPAHPSFLHF